MRYKALLTLDLEKYVTSTERDAFYEDLRKKRWIKISGLTTTWKFSFNDDVTREEAVRRAKSDVRGAARHAGVTSYSAAVQVGRGDVEEF